MYVKSLHKLFQSIRFTSHKNHNYQSARPVKPYAPDMLIKQEICKNSSRFVQIMLITSNQSHEEFLIIPRCISFNHFVYSFMIAIQELLFDLNQVNL